MKLLSNDLSVPVYLKTEDNAPWPQDKMFYLLTKNGLFICRNHPWFQSCALAKSGPSDLAEQKAELSLSYPVLPRALVEKAVGFFRKVYEENHWESALIIALNRQTQQLELVCPEQECSWGSVHYQIPALPHHLALIGDFHSHCDFSPNPSPTDEGDELNRPGLHLIAGYLKDPKPSFACVAVADGTRFEVKDLTIVMEKYESSDLKAVPEEWMKKITHKEYASTYDGGGYEGHGYYSGGNYQGWFHKGPTKEDKEKIAKILRDFLEYTECPSMEIVRTRMFAATRYASYAYCEKRAKQFLHTWHKVKGKHEPTPA